MANESYHEMLYRLCRQNLPPGHPFTLTSTTVPPPSPLCLYPSCPVQGTHAQGLFTYRGVPNDWELEEYDFGASNPPPDIWFARHRIMHETGSNEDYHMVHSFIHYHYVARTAPEQEDRAHSPSVTSSGDHDTNMMELTEEMAETRIGISDGANGVEDTPTHQEDADRPQPSQHRRGSRTESESDAEMERHLSSAYFEMEMEEAENRAAQMNITEETAEASNAPVEPDETRSQPPDGALRDLVEVAYMTCAANAELAPDDGDDGIL
ncbi:MAG: hypothetical protein Q9199_005992 [Rusavskia elegans]